jgi:Glycosyl hydrolase family 76
MYELIGWTPGAGSWNTDGTDQVRWNYTSGLWGGAELSHWWQSALVLRAVARYLEQTGTVGPIYQTLLERTYHVQYLHPWAIASAYFVNMYGDDTGWWGLAWLEAAKYELRYLHNPSDAQTFLWTAEHDALHMMGFKKSCGGFVWEIGYPTNTATNAEFIALAAQLYAVRSAPGPFHDSAKAAQWLQAARSDLGWLERSGLVNMQTGRVSDRLTHSCHVAGGPLTYTEGQTADALVQMGNALHQPSYYSQAERFLNFIATPGLSGMDTPAGILQEQCESQPAECGPAGQPRASLAGTPEETYLDQLVYKGIVATALDDYVRATGSPRYRAYLRNQATAIVYNAITDDRGRPANCTSPASCQFAFRWGWPVGSGRPPTVTAATQMSALAALTGVLAAGS